MKGRGGTIVLYLLLNTCDSRALFLRPRFLSPRTGRISTVRRRTGRGIVSSGDGEGDHTRPDGGKLMWSNILRRKSNTRDDETRSASSENAASSSSKVKAFPPSVIHLGKLRIPPSLRINLAWTRCVGIKHERDAGAILNLGQGGISAPDDRKEGCVLQFPKYPFSDRSAGGGTCTRRETWPS